MNSSGGMNSSMKILGLNVMCRFSFGYVSIVLNVICISGSGSCNGRRCVMVLDSVMVSSRMRMVKMIFIDMVDR